MFKPEITNPKLAAFVDELGVQFAPFAAVEADIAREAGADYAKHVHGATLAAPPNLIGMRGDKITSEAEEMILCHELIHWIGFKLSRINNNIIHISRLMGWGDPEEGTADAGAFLLYKRITGKDYPLGNMKEIEHTHILPKSFFNPDRYFAREPSKTVTKLREDCATEGKLRADTLLTLGGLQ